MTTRTSKPAATTKLKATPKTAPPPPPRVPPVIASSPLAPPPPPLPARVEVHARRVGDSTKLAKVTFRGEEVVSREALHDFDGAPHALHLITHVKQYQGVKEPFVLVIKA